MKSLMTNIYLTDSCNRNCPNCYYPHDNHYMDLITANDLSNWIHKTCEENNVELYKAHFLGGEPLKNFKILIQLLEALKDLPEHPDGKFVVFTNGDLLDRDKMRKLKKYHVRIMLNPTDRELLNILKKLDEIKEVMGGVSLAVTADERNLPRLPVLTEIAVTLQSHIRINRLYNGGLLPGYIEEFGRQMHKVFDILLNSKFVMWPNFILESTYPLWEGLKNCHACGRWLLVFDSDGTIRSCNADMDTKVGSIYTHEFKDIKFHQRWSAKNIPECQGCEWANGGWCQGGCPLTRKLTWNTYNKPTPFCEVFKTLFPRLKELTKRWKEQNEPMPQE